jgi:hypothetical protein
MALPAAEARALLEQVQAEFGAGHLETRALLKRCYEEVRHCVVPGQDLSKSHHGD